MQKGQTLVEAIVVIGMVMLLVTGLISGTTTSLKSSQSGRARSEATKYADEGMELIRLMRDENWTTFASHGGLYCFGSDGLLSLPVGPSCPTNIQTADNALARSATFTWLGNKMQVEVSVVFQQGDVPKTVTLDTYFTQWR
jgi:type II secretory pathway pseudopilin PulG